METQKFKLCITMAGAVSAGAYTAGVMDYLLETIELWEKAKKRNRELSTDHPDYDPSVPMHDIEIDVISGASAGGITATLTLLSLLNNENAYANSSNPEGKNNLFHRSWVEMADDEQSPTLDKFLDRSDLITKSAPESLLNTLAIEQIANQAFNINEQTSFPPYVSADLDLIHTITNLRGIPFRVKFEGTGDGSSIITHHGGFLRFRVLREGIKRGVPDKPDALYYVLNMEEQQDIDFLKNSTLSTAAFPVGLRSRELSIPLKYLQRFPKYLFGLKKGIEPLLDNDEFYKFNSIDGGLINNEPYGIGLKILMEKNPQFRKKENNNYAVIMIDPFPNQDNRKSEANEGKDIPAILKGMFRALRNQVMFNQDGIMEALSLSDRTKFLIAPSRKEKRSNEWIRVNNALACAPLSGFGGFLDPSFRKHDFELGRQNCQTFLRYYFAVSMKDAEQRLGTKISEKATDRFHFTMPPEYEKAAIEDRFFPVIPDIRLKEAFRERPDTKNFGKDAKLSYPEFPVFNFSLFEKRYSKAMKRRLRTLVYRMTGNFWMLTAYMLFLQRRTYRFIRNTIKKELKQGGLLNKIFD